MTVNTLKEKTWLPDQTFPINIFFSHSFDLHWHDHIEWVFMKKGKLRIQIDADIEELEPGELAFINSKQLHGGWPLEEGTEFVSIVFNEGLVRGSELDMTENYYFLPYLTNQDKWPTKIQKNDPYLEEISHSFSRLVEEFESKQPAHELIVKAELLRIFGLFFRYASQYDEYPKISRRVNERDFPHLLHQLRDRFRESITVDEAAHIVNLSPNHFCRVFKQMTSKTLIEYIHLLRINEAERLLMETNDPVSEIALQVGFSSTAYFGRVFKKIKNMSPSEIRK
ncbi:MAG TPA: AraC family transcriptional regulator [Paenibacillus sp.]|jgi:AraC-like DNA-binding protein